MPGACGSGGCGSTRTAKKPAARKSTTAAKKNTTTVKKPVAATKKPTAAAKKPAAKKPAVKKPATKTAQSRKVSGVCTKRGCYTSSSSESSDSDCCYGCRR